MDNTPGMPVGSLDETDRRAVTALLELAVLRQDLRKPPAHPLVAERVALKRLSSGTRNRFSRGRLSEPAMGLPHRNRARIVSIASNPSPSASAREAVAAVVKPDIGGPRLLGTRPQNLSKTAAVAGPCRRGEGKTDLSSRGRLSSTARAGEDSQTPCLL